jgi:HEAT repeat protein
MDLRYVFACGIVWRYTADPEAGWELIRALRDDDRDVQDLAALMLADESQDSSSLLTAATAGGAISAKDAAEVLGIMVANPGTEHRLPPSPYGAS